MFTINGYVPLSTLRRTLRRDGCDYLARHKESVIERMSENLRSGIKWHLHASPADKLERQLLASTRGEMCMCSPDGKIMHLDINEAINAQDHAENVFSIMDGLERTFNAEQCRSFYFRNWLVDYPERIFRWYFFDDCRLLGKRDPCETARKLNYYGHSHHIIPTYYDRTTFTVSLQAYDIARQANSRSPLECGGVEVLRPFEGWSLCVPEAFVKSGWRDAMRRYVGAATEDAQRSAGRMEIAHLIVKAVDDGEVLTREKARSLFASDMGPRPFQRIWEKAAEQRPQLSASGRRRRT